MTEVSKPTVSNPKNTRKKALSIFFFILILITVLTGLYWLFFIKNY